MYFKPEIENDKDLDSGTPKLKALHIVFPWSAAVMEALSASLFCDATFQVTVYNYKVVCITTLDGNKQHRPLMISFIMSSTSEQWSTIFDIFYRRVNTTYHTVSKK